MRTRSMSAPRRSARLASSFMNEILVTSMALAAYLVSSVERASITTMRSWLRLKGAYKVFIASVAAGHRGLREGQQWLKIRRLEVEVLAQGRQPVAAPASLNRIQALLFIQGAELGSALPERLAQISLLRRLVRCGRDHRSQELIRPSNVI